MASTREIYVLTVLGTATSKMKCVNDGEKWQGERGSEEGAYGNSVLSDRFFCKPKLL